DISRLGGMVNDAAGNPHALDRAAIALSTAHSRARLETHGIMRINTMRRWWLLLFALLLVVGSGVVYGLCSERWSPSPHVQIAASRLGKVPMTIDDWQGTDLASNLPEKFRSDFPGILERRYVQQGTQNEITLAIVCGRPGPVSVHTPDVCYE